MSQVALFTHSRDLSPFSLHNTNTTAQQHEAIKFAINNKRS